MRSRIALVAGVVMLLAWLLPNHYYPWTSFYQDYLSFAALCLLTVCLAFRRLDVSLSVVVAACCLLIPVFQVVFGIIYFSGDGVVAAFYLLGFAVAMLVGCEAQKLWGGVSFEFIAWILLIGAFVSSWLAVCQFLGIAGSIWLADLKPGGRPIANLGQPNNLATLIGLGIAALLYLFERRRLAVLSASLLALVLIFGVALTLSRTPWLAFLCLLGWWSIKRKVVGLHTKLIVLLGWGVAYTFVLLALPYIAEVLLLGEVDLVARAVQSHRWALWGQMLHAVLDGPIWGYGWNQVSVAQVAVAIDRQVPIMTEHSHNLIIDLLIWNGPLLGSVIVVSGSVWLLRLVWRVETVESFFAALCVGFLLLHALLEYPLEYAYFLLPCGVLLGLLERDVGGTKAWVVPGYVGGGISVVAFLIMSMVWIEYKAVEHNSRVMRFQSVGFGDASSYQEPPNVVLLSQLWEFVWFARTQARENMEPEEIARMERVAHRYPYPPSLFRYSLALGLNGHKERAMTEMETLRSLHGSEMYEEAMSALVALSRKYPQLKPLNLGVAY